MDENQNDDNVIELHEATKRAVCTEKIKKIAIRVAAVAVPVAIVTAIIVKVNKTTDETPTEETE